MNNISLILSHVLHKKNDNIVSIFVHKRNNEKSREIMAFFIHSLLLWTIRNIIILTDDIGQMAEMNVCIYIHIPRLNGIDKNIR
jgi:hypothetical protein